jgi:DNA-binding NarL/FixJ family response regulator
MPLTILIADDDEGTRLAIGDYLELIGYSVVAASDGKMALNLVEKIWPHLVITDILMPNLDGYGLIQQVRQNPALRLLPVIFLTARTGVDERIRGYQLGCDAYLPKPFELEELGAIVRNLVERTQMIQSAWMQQAPASPISSRPEGSDPAPTSKPAAAPSTTVSFTQREQDVLALISDGLSNAQIGDRLFLSPRTVEKYVSSLLRKTDTNNRAELVRFAADHQLL